MTEPQYLTEKFCQGRISFHESGVLHYRNLGDFQMADWSEAEAEKWRTILSKLRGEAVSARAAQMAPSGPRPITQADIDKVRRQRAADAKGGEDGRLDL